ncbi:MAG: hypothetical protein DRP70_16825 [Spirochaetes bacterium]|nr:MAG: hypothetical protein DRP70_16825 [Spirochaetota bacterium]
MVFTGNTDVPVDLNRIVHITSITFTAKGFNQHMYILAREDAYSQIQMRQGFTNERGQRPGFAEREPGRAPEAHIEVEMSPTVPAKKTKPEKAGGKEALLRETRPMPGPPT